MKYFLPHLPRISIFWLVYLFSFSACFRQWQFIPSGEPQQSHEVSIASEPSDVVIRSGMVLQIVVWKEPSLSGGFTVHPDGSVNLPRINDVQVVGLTTAQLREHLERRFREFVPDAYVTVRIEQNIKMPNANEYLLPRKQSEDDLKGLIPPRGKEEQKPTPGLNSPL